jgi:delta-aminolevulinic acid dehydratase/porphobilinogen synthase
VDGVVQRCAPDPRVDRDLLVVTDVCCASTRHGHCGVVEGEEGAPRWSAGQMAPARAQAHTWWRRPYDGRARAPSAPRSTAGFADTAILAAKYCVRALRPATPTRRRSSGQP